MKRTLPLVCLLLFGMLSLQAQTVSVTFQVNMKVQIVKGAYKPATEQVSARGSFNGWAETAMTDANGDSIYTATVSGIAQNTVVEYKYFHAGGGGTWESGDNKKLTVGTKDTTLAVALFNGEQMPSGAPASVTFEVDMRLPAKQDANFSARKVYVAGSFTDWGTSAVQMTDANNDSIYNVTAQINSATLIKYKFIHSASTASSGTWESIPDREGWIVDGPQTIHKFFDDKDPNVTLADGNILFRVDMSVFQEIGIYDPVKDSLRLRSSFNGWNDGGDPSTWKMNQGVTNVARWTLNVPFLQQALNSQYFYKYYLDLDATKATWTDTYERPASRGGGNRTVFFAGLSNQQDSLIYYDDIKPDYVIPTGTSLKVTFRVNMQGAASAGDGMTFTPATDKVYWLSEQPSFTYSQGWADNDTMRVLQLTDSNGDMVYEGTLTVKAPSFNTFVYRYAFARGGAWGRESDGGPGHVSGYRLRFAGQNTARSFPKNPWTMPIDKWNDTGTQPDQETDPYRSLTLIREDDGYIPSSYQLDQNFPNPFNPSTTIRFEIASADRVQLKVFNLLGQEVASLVDEELTAGSYKVNFDAKHLSSGIYLYRITTGKYVETKKMMFLK